MSSYHSRIRIQTNNSHRKDASKADSIPVTITTYPPVYVYQPLKLYLAYGIAVFCTLLCAFLGLQAMSANGASYSNKFSTFARVTRNVHLYDLVDNTDDASNPCPPEINGAKVTVGGDHMRH